MKTKFYCYFRVSTDDKGQTTEQQHERVFSYAKEHGEIIGYCDEYQSAKNLNRPLLQDAIKICKQQDATLLVLRLDRLSRDVGDAFDIYKKIKIAAVEQDASDILTFSIFCALAQKENQIRSRRIKDKMQLLKEQGKFLGNPKLQKVDGVLSKEGKEHVAKIAKIAAEKRTAKALGNESQKHAFAAIRFMDGTLRAKAAYLDELGFTTPKGGAWSAPQVKRLIERFA